MASSSSSAILQTLRSFSSSSSRRYLSTPSTSSILPPLPSLLPPTAPPSSLPTTTSQAISLIRSQSTPSTGRYILARLHQRNYILHPKDILTVPRIGGAGGDGLEVGTVLKLNKVLEVGSRDWVLRASSASPSSSSSSPSRSISKSISLPTPPPPTLPPNIISTTLTIVEHTRSPLEITLLKKRRKGYEKTRRMKQGWTRLRVGEMRFEGEGVEVV